MILGLQIRSRTELKLEAVLHREQIVLLRIDFSFYQAAEQMKTFGAEVKTETVERSSASHHKAEPGITASRISHPKEVRAAKQLPGFLHPKILEAAWRHG